MTPPVLGKQVADPQIVQTVVHMLEIDVLLGGTEVKAAVPVFGNY